ncbi:hypothetical protein B0O99DRAFT_661659 [Bisporella sp. PMI_857]|nr:hypothetical protein B0O99DRAFT_661659 [Bisporella sp. PMI_857]
MSSRYLWTDPFWNGKRRPFIIATSGATVMLVCLFLANLSYLYGSLFEDGTRVKGINILAIDYDGGVIGQSLAAAYSKLQSDHFPTIHFQPASEYATVEDIRHAVCKGNYWAAIYAQDGASKRLEDALGGGQAANQYKANNTLTYIWNQIRYPTIQDAYISSNMQNLIAASRVAYNSINGTKAATTVNATDPNAVLALLNPISASSVNIKPAPQGARVTYNTIIIMMPIMQQFFLLMALNGISNQFEIYGRLNTVNVAMIRMIVSMAYTILASLATVGYLWAFRESFDVSGRQFALLWLVMWLYMHIHFLVLDAATALIPLSFVTFFVLTWAIMNLTSTFLPFELSPGFYRWGYALPAHQVVGILFQIWSGGCNNQLSRALPVLFAWELFGGAAAAFGVFWRNKAAENQLIKEERRDNNEIGKEARNRRMLPGAKNPLLDSF